jgi:hypothetical protein
MKDKVSRQKQSAHRQRSHPHFFAIPPITKQDSPTSGARPFRWVGPEHATVTLVILRCSFTFSMDLAKPIKTVMRKTKNNYSGYWGAVMIRYVLPVLFPT